jgi:hypothetical protein
VVGVHLPDRMTAIGFWRAMLDAGIYVNVAVPPATPNGVSLLRCSLCAVHTKEQLDHMVEVMTGIGRSSGVFPPSAARRGRALVQRRGHVHPRPSVRSASADAAGRLGELLASAPRATSTGGATASHLHVPEALAGIVADIKAQQPDHIALTGDLVNISLPTEFAAPPTGWRRSAARRASRSSPATTTSMSPTAWPRASACGRLYRRRRPAAGDDFDVFPTCAGAAGVALVGLSSGVPKPPLLATGTLGEAQIAKAERLLADLGARGLCRVVLIHHPPLTTKAASSA